MDSAAVSFINCTRRLWQLGESPERGGVMPLELHTEHENLLVVIATGKLTKEDYAAFLPKVNEMIKEQKKINILFDMHDFHGWEAAAWEDTKFALHHFSDIERLAVVGEIQV
jgi:hypothetical protein